LRPIEVLCISAPICAETVYEKSRRRGSEIERKEQITTMIIIVTVVILLKLVQAKVRVENKTKIHLMSQW
jgi:hypothetical protein